MDIKVFIKIVLIPYIDEQCVKETLPEFGVESEVCFCNTDLCNSSTSIVGNYAIFGTMMIFFFL